MSEISILLFYSYVRNINPAFMFEMPILSSFPNVSSEIPILSSYPYVRNTNPIILSLCQKYQSYHLILMLEISFVSLSLKCQSYLLILMCEISIKSSYLNVRNINSFILSLCQKYQSYLLTETIIAHWGSFVGWRWVKNRVKIKMNKIFFE